MADLPGFQIIPPRPAVERLEFNFPNLYLHRGFSGETQNQLGLGDKEDHIVGALAVNNWPVYDRPGPGDDATVVARVQGLHVKSGDWHGSFTMVFHSGSFKGSTLQVMGIPVDSGNWAIVGGTGDLAMATGVITKQARKLGKTNSILKLTIRGFCPIH